MLGHKGVRQRNVEIDVKAYPIVCSRGSGASAPAERAERQQPR
jgi:hypothetical protein